MNEATIKGKFDIWLSCLIPGVLVVTYIVFGLVLAQTVYAAVFSCSSGNVTCLISAISTANGNGVANTINLDGSTFTLTGTQTFDADGPNGLPDITGEITINGNGSIIERSSASGTPAFRIFHVTGGSLTLNDLTVQNGLTTTSGNNDGGGILNNGILTLTNCTVSGNQAGPTGSDGGISNSGTLIVTNSTFFNNRSGSSGGEGGINNSGTATIINSTFFDNFADLEGGAFGNFGTLTVMNSTFFANGASMGGGIANGGTLTVINSTFSENSASLTGGSILSNSGTVTLKNTILTSLPHELGIVGNCDGTITDGGFNIENGTTCGFSAANNSKSSTDPLLDPTGLQDNRGPTQTIALCTGSDTPTGCTGISPAIDAVTTGCPPPFTDQRGVTRPQDGNNDGIAACDIGAFEVIGNIIISGCNTGVLDQLLGNGLDISGQINECAAIAKNHGKFVSCVSHLTRALKKAGIITGTQKGAINRCATRANIP